MSIFESSPWAGKMLSIYRIIAGLVFMTAGTTKLFSFPSAPSVPIHLMSQAGLAGVLEVFGGLAIVLGLATRPVAFLLAGEMAVAYFQVHFPKSYFPTINGGMPAVLFCFFFLYLTFAGAGEWSVDHLLLGRARKKQ
jgi:putative oxidoreductase